MDWNRKRSWYAGAATLVVSAWLAAVWLLDSLAGRIPSVFLTGLFAVAIAAAYFSGRTRGRGAAVSLVSILLGIAGLWVWSPRAVRAGAVLVLVVGLESIRPALRPGSAGIATLIAAAQLAALAMITMLTVGLFAVHISMWWVGVAWLTFGLALSAAALWEGLRGSGLLPRWPLIALAGVLVAAQVGVQTYGAWQPLPPGPPTWVVPMSGLMALLAMLALAAAELHGHRDRQEHQGT